MHRLLEDSWARFIKAGTGALTNVKVVRIRGGEKSSDCS